MLEVIRYPLQYLPTTVTPSENKIEKKTAEQDYLQCLMMIFPDTAKNSFCCERKGGREGGRGK
jgi:hypothetical protein